MTAINKYLERVPTPAVMDAHVKVAVRGINVSNKMLAAFMAALPEQTRVLMPATEKELKRAIRAAITSYGK